jgi:hypothetical protein
MPEWVILVGRLLKNAHLLRYDHFSSAAGMIYAGFIYLDE